MRLAPLAVVALLLALASGARAAAPCDEGAPCDDGDPCTRGDACVAGECAGFEVACGVLDTGCTVGLCDETGACVSEVRNEGGRCDDGDHCSIRDTCADGVCAGEVINCRGTNAPPCDDVACNPDVDNDFDGVKDVDDAAPLNPRVCRDTDGDGCDDCAVTGGDESGGDPRNDGPDDDRDGLCDAGDPTPHGDGGCAGGGAAGGGLVALGALALVCARRSARRLRA
ncbi:MAG: hypothetical protein H6745_18945 [Deltaproteobacteria bacterium]|nr:hypothetical protein [Deltaproteobacteria bacterium]